MSNIELCHQNIEMPVSGYAHAWRAIEGSSVWSEWVNYWSGLDTKSVISFWPDPHLVCEDVRTALERRLFHNVFVSIWWVLCGLCKKCEDLRSPVGTVTWEKGRARLLAKLKLASSANHLDSFNLVRNFNGTVLAYLSRFKLTIICSPLVLAVAQSQIPLVQTNSTVYMALASM